MKAIDYGLANVDNECGQKDDMIKGESDELQGLAC